MYTSLRKYLDHSSNETKKLVIVYGKLSGTINDARFPIMRGNKVLVIDQAGFNSKIQLVPALHALQKLNGSHHQGMVDKVLHLIQV